MDPRCQVEDRRNPRGGAAVLTVTWMALGTLRELRHWAEPSYWRLRVPGTPGATYF
jgi:hypothetical protein